MTDRAARLIDEIAETRRRIEWCERMLVELRAGGTSLERIDEIMSGVPAECK